MKTIDGKDFAQTLREKIKGHVTEIKENANITPGLAVVLVGEDPASQVYVKNKGIQTKNAGMNSFEHRLKEDVNEKVLLDLIEQLNQDPTVH